MAIPYSRYIVGSLPWYSFLMVSAILIAYLLGRREEMRIGLPKDSMLDMVLVAVPCGIVGARLYYVLMTLDQFVKNPISVFYIWEGGIAVYGSILGGALGVWIYCRVRRRSFAALLDIAAPGLALAQAIGRWGNYFNREAFGPVITNPAWQFFPAGVLITEGGTQIWHVATFFYESLWDLGVFTILWLFRKRVKRRGDLFLWYMALYGCGRFLVEQLRSDSLYLFGCRASQYVSLLICVITATVFLIRLAKQKKGPGWLAFLPGCLLAFARPLMPQNTLGIALTFALFAVSSLCLFRMPAVPLWSKCWLAVDLAVYLAVLLSGNGWLWHSPFFAYAGLSIPPYLALPYTRLAEESAQAAHSEVEHAGREA